MISRRENNKSEKYFNIFNFILWFILLGVSSYLSYFLITKDLLHIKYIKFAFIALIIDLILLLTLCIFKKMKIFNSIMLLISIAVVIFSVIQLRVVLNLFDRVNDNAVYSESTMVVAVLKNSSIVEVKDLENKKVTYADIDGSNVRALLSNLKDEKKINLLTTPSFSYPEVYEKLDKKSVDAVIINKSFYDLIETVYPNFTEKINIIYEYKVKSEVKKKDVKEVENKLKEKKSDDYYNIYISGIDTFGNISTVSRSDVNIIMTVNEKSDKILLTTTPRDSYVNIVGQGDNAYDKLTHAGLFGIDTSIHTLEKLYDINIDYYVRVNFTSFLKIIDLLGGIEVDNPVSFTTRYGMTFPAGKIKLNSDKALKFVRERYTLQNGDADRGKNQERVIAAIIKKLSSREVLSNYSNIVNELSSSIQTNMPMSKIISIAGSRLNSGKSFNVESQALNGKGRSDLKSYLMPNHKLYMMEIYDSSLKEVKTKIYDTQDGK